MAPASLVAWRWASLKYAGTGDHRRVHGLAQVGLGGGLELLEDHRGDLGRRVGGVAHLHRSHALLALDHVVGDQADLLGNLRAAPAHEALDGVDGPRWGW